jgi:tetratricopeptide (TPR) repeat protein
LEKARARYAREVSQKVDSLYREAAELYAKGDYARSAELLEELLRIQPRHLEAVRYLNKIRTLQGEKDTDEAATD